MSIFFKVLYVLSRRHIDPAYIVGRGESFCFFVFFFGHSHLSMLPVFSKGIF